MKDCQVLYMNKYYKIRVNVGNGKYKWIGSGHGLLYPTAEKFALFFTEETLQEHEVELVMGKHDCKIIETYDIPSREWLIYTP